MCGWMMILKGLNLEDIVLSANGSILHVVKNMQVELVLCCRFLEVLCSQRVCLRRGDDRSVAALRLTYVLPSWQTLSWTWLEHNMGTDIKLRIKFRSRV
jgi:hypothetical protein